MQSSDLGIPVEGGEGGRCNEVQCKQIFKWKNHCCYTVLIQKLNRYLVPPDAGPIQLLDFESNENNTVKLAAGAVEKLFLNPLVCDRNVVVISIAGAFRKGKSFLLNYMLRYLYANVS